MKQRSALTLIGLILIIWQTSAVALVNTNDAWDKAKIPVELQSWWTPNFGHIHLGTRVPLGQVVSGTLPLSMRVVLHNNPSTLDRVNVYTESSLIAHQVMNVTCPYNGTTDTNCVWEVNIDVDTTQMPDGWRELRLQARTTTPDGHDYYNSSGIPVNVQNGTADSNYNRFCNNTSLIGRGWYDGPGYTNAIVECVPLAPVSGTHVFRVRAQEPSTHLEVALDKAHHIAATSTYPEQATTTGSILFSQSGNFQSFFNVPVDTTQLADGWHALAVTSTGPASGPSVCSYCNGEINKPAGVAKFWFYVDNGGDPPPPAENTAPDVDAGVDQTVELSESAILDGTVTDDGLPNPPANVSTEWLKVSGPGTVTFGNANAVDTTASFSAIGVYVLSLTGDDSELVDSDEVTITVTADEEPPPSGSGIQHVSTVTGSASGSNSVSTSGMVTAIAGDLYLAAIATRDDEIVSSVSGMGLAWTKVDEQCSGRGATSLAVFKAQGTPSGNSIVTATLASLTDNIVLAVSRYSNAAPVNAVGNVVSHNANGSNGACSGGTDGNSYAFANTATATEGVMYSAVSMRNRTHTPGAGYAELVELQVGSGGDVAGMAVQDTPFSQAGSVNVSGSFNSTTDWSAISIELR